MRSQLNIGTFARLGAVVFTCFAATAQGGIIDSYSTLPERETSTIEPGRHFTFDMSNEDSEGTLRANTVDMSLGDVVDTSPLLYDVTSRHPSKLDPVKLDDSLLAAGGELLIRTGCFAQGRRCSAPLHLDAPRRRAIARSILWEYVGATPISWRGNLAGMDPYGETKEDEQSIVLTSLDADDRQAAGYAARLIFQ